MVLVFGGAVALTVGVAIGGTANASAPNPRTFPNDNAQINDGNVPADSTTYNAGDDCGQGEGQVGWYFVLPPNTDAQGATEIDQLDLLFASGTKADVTFTHPNGTLNKAVYISNGDDTLLDAGAMVSPGTATSEEPAQFVLSHVCGGDTGSSSSSSTGSTESSGSSGSSASTGSSSDEVLGESTTQSSTADGASDSVLGEELARTGYNNRFAVIGLMFVTAGAVFIGASRARSRYALARADESPKD